MWRVNKFFIRNLRVWIVVCFKGYLFSLVKGLFLGNSLLLCILLISLSGIICEFGKGDLGVEEGRDLF